MNFFSQFFPLFPLKTINSFSTFNRGNTDKRDDDAYTRDIFDLQAFATCSTNLDWLMIGWKSIIFPCHYISEIRHRRRKKEEIVFIFLFFLNLKFFDKNMWRFFDSIVNEYIQKKAMMASYIQGAVALSYHVINILLTLKKCAPAQRRIRRKRNGKLLGQGIWGWGRGMGTWFGTMGQGNGGGKGVGMVKGISWIET